MNVKMQFTLKNGATKIVGKTSDILRKIVLNTNYFLQTCHTPVTHGRTARTSSLANASNTCGSLVFLLISRIRYGVYKISTSIM